VFLSKIRFVFFSYVTATVRGSEHWIQISVAFNLRNLIAQTWEPQRLETILAWSNRDRCHLLFTWDLVWLEMLSISPEF